MKDDLQRYLQAARDAVLWKLDGLSEYDVRRPLTWVDGAVGMRLGNDNMPPGDEEWWHAQYRRVEEAARKAGG